jgi:hypothetical protein
MSTFHYKLVRRIHVAVHGRESPSDEEWETYLNDIGQWLRSVEGIFSYTVGGGPSAKQRSFAVEFWKRQPKQPPIAVVTPSILVVRMAGALRWFMPTQIQAFTPRNIQKAFDHLQLSAGERSAVEASVIALGEAQGLTALGRDVDLRHG